jgi:hypothetical protein
MKKYFLMLFIFSTTGNKAYGVSDYTEWMLKIGYNFYNNTISVIYQDTDIIDNVCTVGCGATAVLGISRQF